MLALALARVRSHSHTVLPLSSLALSPSLSWGTELLLETKRGMKQPQTQNSNCPRLVLQCRIIEGQSKCCYCTHQVLQSCGPFRPGLWLQPRTGTAVKSQGTAAVVRGSSGSAAGVGSLAVAHSRPRGRAAAAGRTVAAVAAGTRAVAAGRIAEGTHQHHQPAQHEERGWGWGEMIRSRVHREKTARKWAERVNKKETEVCMSPNIEGGRRW
jgi:hypothetical protein